MAATSVPSGRTQTTRRGVGGGLVRLATETKAAFKTSEFYAFLAVLAMILIAGHAIDTNTGTGGDHFAADKVWLYATILTVGYMVSRGLAKSGSSEPYWRDSGDNYERDIDGRDDR
jgi:hypothetical protein